MKKISITLMLVLPVLLLKAQDPRQIALNRPFNQEVFNICASIFVLMLFMGFILTILKRYFDHKIKNKIIDKGIPDSTAISILGPKPEDDKKINIKWFSILTGLGVGLTIVNYSRPLGMLSLAIMCFSIAGGFLGYYLFIRRS